MDNYCPNCGEDGDMFECVQCGVIKCSDCITEKELVSGYCNVCLKS